MTEVRKEKLGKDSISIPDIDRTNTNVTSQIHNLVQKLKKESDEQTTLKYYQYICMKVATSVNLGSRGLLVKLPMGYGKTITAVSAALMVLINPKCKRKIVVLLTKSLRENFKKGIREYFELLSKDTTNELYQHIPKDIEAFITKYFSFVSMNASNMMQQLNRAADGELEALESAALESKLAEVLKVGTLDNKLLIVDEAHNLFRSIANGNARGFYDMVMNARNLRILFLTGTPIVTDPFELVPCMNMLGSQNRRHLTLPETYQEFYQLYVDTERGEIRNREKLQNRLMGLISYIEPIRDPVYFPKRLPDKIIRVPMSEHQFAVYNVAREKEKDEVKGGPGGSAGPPGTMQKPKSMNAASTYRVKSRKYCNFVYPRNVSSLDGVKISDFPECSGTYFAAVKLIEERIKLGQNGYMYSQFTQEGGLGAFQHLLHMRGFEEYKPGMPLDKSKKRFAVFSGDSDIMARTVLQNTFSSSENMHGGLINVLLISSTGAEGLDLKNARYYIAEPYWNKSRDRQLAARGDRYNAHIALPKAERTFQEFMFLSAPPDAYADSKGKHAELTTHEELYFRAEKNQVIIDKFMDMLNEVCLECALDEHEYQCRMCNPTNKPLFMWDFSKDMMLRDPCNPVKRSREKARKFTFDGNPYFFTEKSNGAYPYTIVRYDANIDAYVPLKTSHKEYPNMVEYIAKNVST